MTETTFGEGRAVGSLDGIGRGPGFRKIRRELGVTAFGVNAVVRSNRHVSGSEEAVYLCVGGTGGHVGRDGIMPEGEPRERPHEARF
jgi:hypothetical protein